MHHTLRSLTLATTTALLAAGSLAAPVAAAEVNLYSYRQESLIRPLLDDFHDQTGIDVNVVYAPKGMLERLKAEGMNSPADAILTVDISRLMAHKVAGLLQPVESDILRENIPAQYRDPENEWFGLTIRSRVVFASRDRVKPEDLSTYEDLADPKWKGRLCIRSSSNVYNQSLLAAMIVHHGVDAAQAWAAGIVANMARPPQGGDRDQIKAVAAGECDIAVGNTYYYGGMQASDKADDREAAAKVFMFWPNQDGRGAHVNISGAGVTRSAKHKEEAVKLLEYLTSERAQRLYASSNYEFPIRAGIEVDPVVAAWGTFKADPVPLHEVAEQQPEALKIFDRVDWR
ncbi:Fe(3+) ABC transporter substrate-binding protein [Oceanibacterium hippocampi]|uniref:Iron uptake protein A1 n=1 Tax=Oceanibacterium hippocampi TaxID=745714 RepID=A0A1Y5R8R1_9PROT|nr:Fe(3+) ABC transporter substrate-binding protein [Oceanibacterium hippocampi]SLN11751.1 Iron uptake protein A1 precursor [Oceanibacterium hippocampi]